MLIYGSINGPPKPIFMATFRKGYRRILAVDRDPRSPERITAHYELERELAARLRNARKTERPAVYGHVYSELFARIADHPQHTASRDVNSARLRSQIRIVTPYLSRSSTFVEIGCGDAALSVAVAQITGTSIGVDVTEALIPVHKPSNFQFLKTDGTTLNLESSSADLVYSNSLIEHLHPDDARDQLVEIHRVLKKGGRYICITPNAASGPHDISKYFDEVATGFHMREYDYGSLKTLFAEAGFRRFRAVVVIRGHQVPIPYLFVRAAEIGAARFSQRFRVRVYTNRIARLLLGLNAIAVA
jgi:ubiquinone/menaquinone biosynthesis C-methylase UbiE